MKNLRRKRLGELLASPRFNGDRTALYQAAGITKGRLSQLFDPLEPFGDVAAKNLCDALGLPQGWFDAAPETKIHGEPTQSGAIPPDYKPNQPLAPVEPARAAININANRRMKPTSQDVVAELGALLAGVEPGRMGSVIAALTDLARSPTDEVLRDSLARLMAPAAFTLPNQRMGS